MIDNVCRGEMAKVMGTFIVLRDVVRRTTTCVMMIHVLRALGGYSRNRESVGIRTTRNVRVAFASCIYSMTTTAVSSWALLVRAPTKFRLFSLSSSSSLSEMMTMADARVAAAIAAALRAGILFGRRRAF